MRARAQLWRGFGELLYASDVIIMLAPNGTSTCEEGIGQDQRLDGGQVVSNEGDGSVVDGKSIHGVTWVDGEQVTNVDGVVVIGHEQKPTIRFADDRLRLNSTIRVPLTRAVKNNCYIG